MPIEPLSDEDCVAAFNLWQESGRNYTKAAEAAGVVRATMQHRVMLAFKRKLVEDPRVRPGFEISRINEITNEDGEVIRTSVSQRPEAGDQFEMPPGYVPGKITVALGPDGRVEKQWLRAAPDNTGIAIDAIKAAFDAYEGRAELAPAPKQCDAMLMSVYPLADVHLGLMAWGRETGESYDLRIAGEKVRTNLQRLIRQSPDSETALVLNLGDFFHADDSRNQTPSSGFKLDVDGRYFKVLTTGVQLMMDCIDQCLQKHQRVYVRNLPGNHDPHASIALTVALSAFYSKEPRVSISDDPSEFFYHRFGNNLIGANHGHRVKPGKLAMHMAATRAEDWGKTFFRYYYTGHIHHETGFKKEDGVIVESFQSLAAKDAFHASHGYLGGQSIQSITLHYNDGEIGRHRINIGPPA